ncbi:hypothetical protein TNCV_3406591 [Trichonephila clavipes]|nr:hypothetical protein TNCV_3406591 [Trichonephila clavipes]
MRQSGSMTVPEQLHLGQLKLYVDDEIASILTSNCVGIDCVRSSFMKTHCAAASSHYTKTFVNNPYVRSSMFSALIEANKRKALTTA